MRTLATEKVQSTSGLKPHTYENEFGEHKWASGWVRLEHVIRFPQVRKTFEEDLLQELADDIARNGIIQPSLIAKLSPDRFMEYVDVFEKISKTKLLTNSYTPIREGKKLWYLVLVAGERRFRAHQILWNTGCSACKEEAARRNRILKEGECFKKHFPKGYMEARIGFNITPEEAKSVQHRENMHIKPPPHEEAYAHRDFYDYLKVIRPQLTIKEFAGIVGISTEKVRNAIWFCDLPQRLREAVEKRLIKYTNALEMRKIMQEATLVPSQKERIINNEIDYLLISPKIKHDDYKKRIDSLLASFGMATLFDTSAMEMTKKQKRKTVAVEMLPGLILYNSYGEKIKRLLSEGAIGKGKLYSGGSPTKQLKQIMDRLQALIPGFNLTKAQQERLNFNFDK